MVTTHVLVHVKVFSLVKYCIIKAVNPVIRSKFERELRIIFLYFKEFSFYFLIFSLIILFGTSILFIWLLKISKCEMNSNWTEALKCGISSFYSILSNRINSHIFNSNNYIFPICTDCLF